jgi:hypothetical protein
VRQSAATVAAVEQPRRITESNPNNDDDAHPTALARVQFAQYLTGALCLVLGIYAYSFLFPVSGVLRLC